MKTTFNIVDSICRRFVVNEGQPIVGDGLNPNTLGYLQVISEILHKIKPSSLRDQRYIDVAQKHLYEITKHVKKLNERIQLLEEEIKVIKEEKSQNNS